jgi:transposase InsO family protein
MSQRGQILALIGDACAQGARHASACAVVQLSERTVQRWRGNPQGDQRLEGVRVPHNKLPATQREIILAIVNSPAYCDLPPSQIVPRLADEGTYLASESTLYRLLREARQLTHRLASTPCAHSRPVPLMAAAPNQIYSWDISYLPSLIHGMFFYLYFFIDIYSRKIVGWQVHDRECSGYAAALIKDISAREGILPDQLILHSDNGAPMKGVSMLSMMQMLGIVPSLSRPGVSDDNPYSESLFRTVKYAPVYPGYFHSLKDARDYFEKFVHWYNDEHRHSGIKFVTPAQRHRSEDEGILHHRKQVYEAAKVQYPERWNGRATRNWDRIPTVHLNPGKSKSQNSAMAVAA